jgi:hypothetical protein
MIHITGYIQLTDEMLAAARRDLAALERTKDDPNWEPDWEAFESADSD